MRTDPEILPIRHAGMCYASSASELMADWDRLLDHHLQSSPPDALPKAPPPVLIVPHIDFRVNLEHYVRAYSHLYAASRFPELVIILGVGHRCPQEFSAHPFALDTPLGVIPPDLDAWQQCRSLCPFELSRSPESFDGEHSLEFAAVWLQVIRELAFPNHHLKVLPVLCGGLFENLYLNAIPDENDDFFLFGEALETVIRSRPQGSTLIIASIDGCHVGPRFQHQFRGNRAAQKAVGGWEADLWKKAFPESYPEFFDHLSAIRNLFHFDGVGVLSLLLQHFPYHPHGIQTDCWYEHADQSFVTFSSGIMEQSHPDHREQTAPKRLSKKC